MQYCMYINPVVSHTQVDIWEALRAQRPSRPNTPSIHAEEERQLQR
jgi:hypothetical protein